MIVKKIRSISLMLVICIFTSITANAQTLKYETDDAYTNIMQILNEPAFTQEERVDYQNFIENYKNIDNTFIDDTYSYEVNKETGDIIHTIYDADGNILNQVNTNFYENLERILLSQINYKERIDNIINTDSTLEGYEYKDIERDGFETEKVYESRLSLLDDTYYSAGKLKYQNVDYIKIGDSVGNESYGFYDVYTNAPGRVINFMRSADNTITAAADIVTAVGVTAGVTIVAHFFGGTATQAAVSQILNSLGLSGVSSAALTLKLNKYFTAISASDQKYREAVPGWHQIHGSWYWYENGQAVTSAWRQINGHWYYLKSDGVMATGWQSIGGAWYYFWSGGSMAKGWLELNGKWYYLDSEYGYMKTNWQQISGKWYYFYSDGSMATNTEIDGWKIDGNGVATPLRSGQNITNFPIGTKEVADPYNDDKPNN